VILRKWNERKREYEPYKIPDDWNVRVYSNDMNMLINCARCGKKISFGDCYSSYQIHTGMGMGYVVCLECHAKEYEERVNGGIDD
jgi:hypothetical protein